MVRMTVEGKSRYIGLFDCELDVAAAYIKSVDIFSKGGNPFTKERKKSSKYKGVSFVKNTKKMESLCS